MSAFELSPATSIPSYPESTQLVWGAANSQAFSVRSSVDAWASSIGAASGAAIDLMRLAAAAYMADRQTPRGSGFSRSITLHVQLTDSDKWVTALDTLTQLLEWLTGDKWTLSVSSDGLGFPEISVDEERPEIEAVSLLSGGLDSMAGALIENTPRIFVGHWDNPTVKASQDRSWPWLRDKGSVSGDYLQILLRESDQKQEPSTRSRSLLFFSLATAIGTARGATKIEIPENGFTSLNVPLGNNRGGALTTRSTHPWTLQLFEKLLEELDIGIQLLNPYEMLTKGELLALASTRGAIEEGATATLSCGKLDGRLYKGGNQNFHCGLCIPCLVRRGAFLGSGLTDNTVYLSKTLHGDSLKSLHDRRKNDLAAVRATIVKPVDEFSLLSQGPFPEGFDLTAAVKLCARGFSELMAALEE